MTAAELKEIGERRKMEMKAKEAQAQAAKEVISFNNKVKN